MASDSIVVRRKEYIALSYSHLQGIRHFVHSSDAVPLMAKKLRVEPPEDRTLQE
jgi:hypothetical protein